MKEDMAAAAEENARKMMKIQEELRASNEKTDAILAMLSRMQSFAVAPQPAYPFPAGYPPHAPFPAGPSYQPTPHPTPVVTPPPPEMPADTANIHDAVSAAIRENEGLRTRVREPSGPTVLTPPPPTVGLPSQTDTAPSTVFPRIVDRTRGDDTARHTDMLIVEDTQGSPSDTAGVQRMDVDDSPATDRHPPAYMGDVRMETLDLGGEDDHIQQTQASQAARSDDHMEMEAHAAVDITNARSLIAEEGAAARSSAAAAPSDDEVTHL